MNIRRPATALLALIATLTLGGCTMTPKIPDSRKTGQQLRTETIDAMNAAITASGLPDGWGLDWEPGSKQWNPETVEFLGAGCTTVPGNDGQLFEIDQFHAPVGDPAAFAHKVADYWKHQGYTVSYIAETLGEDPDIDIRADRPDGTLYAGLTAHNIAFVLSVYSECSTHPSLDMFAGPHGYRPFDASDPDPYNPTAPPTITPYPTNR